MQLLQSLRLARVHLKAATRLVDLKDARVTGLIDGGATACLRTTTEQERIPKVSAQLAHGSCELHINAAGTLLAGAAGVKARSFPSIAAWRNIRHVLTDMKFSCASTAMWTSPWCSATPSNAFLALPQNRWTTMPFARFIFLRILLFQGWRLWCLIMCEKRRALFHSTLEPKHQRCSASLSQSQRSFTFVNSISTLLNKGGTHANVLVLLRTSVLQQNKHTSAQPLCSNLSTTTRAKRGSAAKV